MQIVGVSSNSPSELEAWGADRAPAFEFELWSDEGRGVLAGYYGAGEPGAAYARKTIVIDAYGRLLLEYDVDLFSVGSHAQSVLDDCTAIFGQ